MFLVNRRGDEKCRSPANITRRRHVTIVSHNLRCCLSLSFFLFFAEHDSDPDRRGLTNTVLYIGAQIYAYYPTFWLHRPWRGGARPSSCLPSYLFFFFRSPRPSSSFRPLLLFLDQSLVNCLAVCLRANFSFRIKLHTVYPACPFFALVFVFPLPLLLSSPTFPYEIIIIRTAYEGCNARNSIAPDRLVSDRADENLIHSD